jgi:hypothetical protein
MVTFLRFKRFFIFSPLRLIQQLIGCKSLIGQSRFFTFRVQAQEAIDSGIAQFPIIQDTNSGPTASSFLSLSCREKSLPAPDIDQASDLTRALLRLNQMVDSHTTDSNEQE